VRRSSKLALLSPIDALAEVDCCRGRNRWCRSLSTRGRLGGVAGGENSDMEQKRHICRFGEAIDLRGTPIASLGSRGGIVLLNE
jgi:hypothetical protein